MLVCVILAASCSANSSDVQGTTDGLSGGENGSGTSSILVDEGEEPGLVENNVGADDLGSPVANFLGYRVPGLGEVDTSRIEVEAEEAIAACMRAEGFNYIAWVDDTALTNVPVDPSIDSESREFAERYGFGISTQAYSQEDVGPDLVGHSGNGSGVVFSENPNEQIVNALDEAESFAYNKAYWGGIVPCLVAAREMKAANNNSLAERS